MHLIAVVLGCQATSVCTADIEDAEQFDFLVQIGFCWTKHSYFLYILLFGAGSWVLLESLVLIPTPWFFLSDTCL